VRDIQRASKGDCIIAVPVMLLADFPSGGSHCEHRVSAPSQLRIALTAEGRRASDLAATALRDHG
jgi:hypothetical protein